MAPKTEKHWRIVENDGTRYMVRASDGVVWIVRLPDRAIWILDAMPEWAREGQSEMFA